MKKSFPYKVFKMKIIDKKDESIVKDIDKSVTNKFRQEISFKMGLKMLKTKELPGALPPGPPMGLCPWTLLGGLGSPQTPSLIFRVFLQMPLSSQF